MANPETPSGLHRTRIFVWKWRHSDERHSRILDVVLFDEEDESPFVGLLQVEAA